MPKGVPTVGPRGILFRSRVEATWAGVFDALGLRWEYEPYDLEGYIPDFVLAFDDGGEVLVEVKHSATLWTPRVAAPHLRKVRDSGWVGEVALLGATTRPLGGGFSLGVGLAAGASASPDRTAPDVALTPSEGGWALRAGGGAEERRWAAGPGGLDFGAMWAAAKNASQWAPAARPRPRRRRK